MIEIFRKSDDESSNVHIYQYSPYIVKNGKIINALDGNPLPGLDCDKRGEIALFSSESQTVNFLERLYPNKNIKGVIATFAGNRLDYTGETVLVRGKIAKFSKATRRSPTIGFIIRDGIVTAHKIKTLHGNYSFDFRCKETTGELRTTRADPPMVTFPHITRMIMQGKITHKEYAQHKKEIENTLYYSDEGCAEENILACIQKPKEKIHVRRLLFRELR